MKKRAERAWQVSERAVREFLRLTNASLSQDQRSVLTFVVRDVIRTTRAETRTRLRKKS